MPGHRSATRSGETSSTTISLRRPVAPATSRTFERGRSSSSARRRTSDALAAPPTAGAATRVSRTPSSETPSTRSRPPRGVSRTANLAELRERSGDHRSCAIAADYRHPRRPRRLTTGRTAGRGRTAVSPLPREMPSAGTLPGPLAKERSPNADHRGSFLDRDREIVGHAHRQTRCRARRRGSATESIARGAGRTLDEPALRSRRDGRRSSAHAAAG